MSGPIYLDVSIRASMTAKTSFAHGDRGLSHELRAKSEVRAKTRSHFYRLFIRKLEMAARGRSGRVAHHFDPDRT